MPAGQTMHQQTANELKTAQSHYPHNADLKVAPSQAISQQKKDKPLISQLQLRNNLAKLQEDLTSKFVPKKIEYHFHLLNILAKNTRSSRLHRSNVGKNEYSKIKYS